MTGKNSCSTKIIQTHAEVVSLFVKNGYPEYQNEHPAPPCANVTSIISK
jgi:hypothetical protein